MDRDSGVGVLRSVRQSPPLNPVGKYDSNAAQNEYQERNNLRHLSPRWSIAEQVSTARAVGEGWPKKHARGKAPGYADVGPARCKAEVRVGVYTS